MKLLTLSFTKVKFLIIPQLITLICIIFAFFCNDSSQNLIAFLGIFSFGILHGANDLKIIDKNFGKNQKKIKGLFFLSYVFVVILGIGIFYWIPGIALIFFVLVSCYHFGEQHLERIMDFKKGKLFFYFTYGAFIFLMLFSLHYNETVKVIFQISGKVLPFNFFIYSLLLTFLSIIIQAFFHFKKSRLLIQEFLLLGLLALLFASGNLLFSFGIYFVVWHSLPSLNSQIKFLYDGKVSDKTGYKKYIKASFLYWILALGSLAGVYFFADIPREQFLPLFFSFLAAITFPHAIVMERMFSFNSNQ